MTDLRTRLAVAALVALTLLSPFIADLAHAEELSYGELVDVAADYFPTGTARYAARIAICESGGATWAEAAGFDRRLGVFYRYVGLFQIDPDLHQWRTVKLFGRWRSLYEGRVNAAVAADILAEQGWTAWPWCSRHA